MNDRSDSNLESDLNDPTVEEEEYSFLKETIKKDKRSRVVSRRSLISTLIHGVVFGAIACLSFFMLSPWIEGFFYEEEVAEIPPITMEIPNEPEEPEEPEEPIEPEPEEPEEEEEPYEEEEIIPLELTAESYQEILDSLHEIAMTANQSIAYIEGFEGEWDIIDEERARANRITGLVAADNGSELMIVAHNGLVGNFDYFRVIMADGEPRWGRLVIQDITRQLAVFAVDIEGLSEEQLEEIEHATWGNSNRTRQGDLVIAVGNVLGHGDGHFYGTLGSNQSFETIIDGRFRMLGTDILTSPRGTGVLFNKRGEVIGLLMPGPWQREGSITANVLGISDLSQVLGKLVNGEPLPYFGVEGINVTEELSYVLEIPQGIYVRHLSADSPAMMAGIQNGDVIVAFNNYEVENKQQLLSEILASEIGAPIEVRVNRRGAEEYVEMYFTVIIESR